MGFLMIVYAVEYHVTDECTFGVTETVEIFFKEEDATAYAMKMMEDPRYESNRIDVVTRTIK